MSASIACVFTLITIVLSHSDFVQGAEEPSRKILVQENSLPGGIKEQYEYYVDAGGIQRRHGPAKFLNAAGRVTQEVIFVDGRMHGPNTRYDGDGKVIMRGQSVDGIYDGKWEWFASNGRSTCVKNYKRGRIIGTVRYLTDQGVLNMVEDHDEQGQLARRETYYEDGTKQSAESYAPSDDPTEFENVKSGAWTLWRRDGTIMAEGVWKSGKPWSGVCHVQARVDRVPEIKGEYGDVVWARFLDGKFVETVTIRP